jgi:hypothetical protein
MSFFQRLFERIRQDDAWTETYRHNKRWSKYVASQMPLIHVSGDGQFDFVDLMAHGAVPTSEDSHYCTDDTRRKENEFGFRHSVYFYPGRAHESFGSVAFGVASNVEESHTGSVTWTGIYASAADQDLPNNNPSSRREYIAASTIDLNAHYRSLSRPPRWRVFFAKFLAAYFRGHSNFWDETPARDDPHGIFDRYRREWEWRAWTFEVRFYEDVPLSQVAVWCPRVDTWNDIRKFISNRSGNTHFLHSFRQFNSAARRLAPANDREDYEYTTLIEEWARHQCIP